MKTIVVVLLALASFGTAINIPIVLKTAWTLASAPKIAVCMIQSPTKMAYALDWIYNVNFPDDPSFKCFMECVFLKLGLLKADKSINYELIRKLFPTTPAGVVESCDRPKTGNTCEWAYEVAKCSANLSKI